MPKSSFGGPYVQLAAICQTAIIDKQDTLSVIRIQDRIQIMGITDQMQPQPLINYQLVLCLKSGEMRGKSTLRLTPVTPSGKELAPAETPALFEGDERGVAFVAPLNVIAEEEGLYWLEVALDGQLLTRIPFRVMYQKLQLPPGMVSPNIG